MDGKAGQKKTDINGIRTAMFLVGVLTTLIHADQYQNLIDSVITQTKREILEVDGFGATLSGFSPYEFSFRWHNPVFADTPDVPGYSGPRQSYDFDLSFTKLVDSTTGVRVRLTRAQSRTAFDRMRETLVKHTALLRGTGKHMGKILKQNERESTNSVADLAFTIAGFAELIVADSVHNDSRLIPCFLETNWRSSGHFIPSRGAVLNISFIDVNAVDSLNCISLRRFRRGDNVANEIKWSSKKVEHGTFAKGEYCPQEK